MNVKTFISWMLVVCVMPMLTGCDTLREESLTGRLWSSDMATDHDGPAPYPNLQLAQAADHKDVLVQYDEVRDRDAVIRRRAYWLHASEARIAAGKKPRFVDPRKAAKLEPISVETNGAAASLPAASPQVRAVLVSDQRHFILIANGNESGTFFLPAYRDGLSRTELVAVTPLAVLGDAAICTTIVALVVGVLYLEGAANDPTYSHR